jgi:hypothetical protein
MLFLVASSHGVHSYATATDGQWMRHNARYTDISTRLRHFFAAGGADSAKRDVARVFFAL